MAKQQGSIELDVFGNNLSQPLLPEPSVSVPNPTTGQNQIVPKPKTGVTSIKDQTFSALQSMAAQPKPEPDILRRGRPHAFNADLNHHQYERYYNHPNFKELGFSPWRDNEKIYNKMTSGWSDFKRTFAQWRSLAATGFTDAMSFGPTSDRRAAEKFERAMAIGNSTRGGLTGFSTNLFLNSGYTFGIIAEMLVEEAILYGIGLFTGGSTWGVATARAGQKLKMLEDATDMAKMVERGAEVTKTLDNLKDINKARQFWQKTATAGKWVGNKILPETAQVVKHWDDIKDLDNFTKMATSAASFYKDVRNIRLAYSESALEAGMVENEMVEELYQAAYKKNGYRPLTEEQMQDVRKRAKDASMATFNQNLPAIWLSNQIVFDNVFNAWSPVRKLLKQPAYKNIAGELVREAGKSANPWQIVESNFKGTLKMFTKPRSYAKFGLNYFRANIAEGLQETTQEIIAGAAKDYYKQDPNDPYLQGYWTMLGDNMEKQLSPEGLEIFMSGFLMGGPVNIVTGSISKSVDQIRKFRDPEYATNRVKAMETLIKKQKLLNDFNADPMNYFNYEVKNAESQRNYKIGMEQALAQGDKKVFYDLRAAAEGEHVITAIEGGHLDTFIERMQDYATMTNEEIAEAFPALKDNPEQYKDKVNTMIQIAKNLEQDYHDFTSKFPPPPNPSAYKGDFPAMAAAAVDQVAYEGMRKQYLFLRHSFRDSVQRYNSILQAAGKELETQKLSGADFITLFDMDSTQDLINQKKDIIWGNKEKGTKGMTDIIPETEEGAELSEAAKRLNREKEVYNALVKFDKARDVYHKTSKSPDAQKSREEAAQKFKEAYTEVVGVLTNQEQFSDNVDASFEALLDATDLRDESKILREAVNQFLNPQFNELQFKRIQEYLKLAHQDRAAFMEKLLNNYMDRMLKNKLLKMLFDEAGVFLTPEGIAAIEENFTYPKKLYNVTSPYGEVKKGSDPWNTAMAIIRDYIKNVKNKPIPEADYTMSEQYDVSSREKLPGDNRTYEELADQFGFDPTSERTEVPLTEVLQAVIDSDFSTEPEKQLARKYLERAEEDAMVSFVNNNSTPGHVFHSEGKIEEVVIDARYNSADYSNGGTPIEFVILHEETHRLTVLGLAQDSKFNSEIEALRQRVIEHFETTRTGKPLYGLHNNAEFVAEAMSNPTFQQLLSEIPVQGAIQKNAWTAFVDAVLEFLEKTFGTNLYDYSVLNAAQEIISAKIDIDFPGEPIAETQTRITRDTPVHQMPDSLKRELLTAFDRTNDSLAEADSPLLKNRKQMTDQQVLESQAFRQWLKTSPTAGRVLNKYDDLSRRDKKVPEKVEETSLYYTGKNPAVDALVTREVDGETQVLLIKRGDDSIEGGKWAMPGGFVDTNAQPGTRWRKGKETITEAAIRELKEETGIDLTEVEQKEWSLGGLGVRDDRGRDPRNTSQSWVEAHLEAVKIPEGMATDDIVGQDDAQDAKWFTKEELNNLNDNELAFDHADMLAQQGLREKAKPADAKLAVGTKVKVGTKKDGIATIAEDRGDKVLLDDGRQVAKKNLTPVEEPRQTELEFEEEVQEWELQAEIPVVKLKVREDLPKLEDGTTPTDPFKIYDLTEEEFERNKKTGDVKLIDSKGNEFVPETYQEYQRYLEFEKKMLSAKVEQAIKAEDEQKGIESLVVYLSQNYGFDLSDVASIKRFVKARREGKTNLSFQEWMKGPKKRKAKEAPTETEELPEGFRYVEEGEVLPAGDYITRLSVDGKRTITNAPKKVAEKEGLFPEDAIELSVRGIADGFENWTDVQTEDKRNIANNLPGTSYTLKKGEMISTIVEEDNPNNPETKFVTLVIKADNIGDKPSTYVELGTTARPAYWEVSVEVPVTSDASLYEAGLKETAKQIILASDNKYDSQDRKMGRIRQAAKEFNLDPTAIKTVGKTAIPETPTKITPDMRDLLEGLGYNRYDIRNMTVDEALDIIDRGVVKGQDEAAAEAAIREQEARLAQERADIRNEFEDMLADATSLADMKLVQQKAKEILSDVALKEVSEYTAEELDEMIAQRKRELAEEVDFDALERGSVVFLQGNDKTKYVVVKRTPNTVKLRKFGDVLGKVFTITRSKASEKIQYMDNEFIDEAELAEKELTPEQKDMLKRDQQKIKDLSDPDTIREDIKNANDKSNDELDDDLRDAYDENCK